jgi:hypothetical protein
MSDEEIVQNASLVHSARSAISRTASCASMDRDTMSMGGIETTSDTAVVSGMLKSRQEALVSMLGDLMKNVGPDNYVFQAAKQAMQSAQRRLPGGGDTWETDARRHRSTSLLDDKYASVNLPQNCYNQCYVTSGLWVA